EIALSDLFQVVVGPLDYRMLGRGGTHERRDGYVTLVVSPVDAHRPYHQSEIVCPFGVYWLVQEFAPRMWLTASKTSKLGSDGRAIGNVQMVVSIKQAVMSDNHAGSMTEMAKSVASAPMAMLDASVVTSNGAVKLGSVRTTRDVIAVLRLLDESRAASDHSKVDFWSSASGHSRVKGKGGLGGDGAGNSGVVGFGGFEGGFSSCEKVAVDEDGLVLDGGMLGDGWLFSFGYRREDRR
nr:hypothetical protein [Tanacetum cinerariifolium]